MIKVLLLHVSLAQPCRMPYCYSNSVCQSVKCWCYVQTAEL